jgi:hypothetical protein
MTAKAYCPLCGKVRNQIHTGDGHQRSRLEDATPGGVETALGAVMGVLHKTEVGKDAGGYYALVITRKALRFRRQDRMSRNV